MDLAKVLEQDEEILLKPIQESHRNFYITVVLLSAVVAWSLVAYFHQLRNGLGVTGLNRPVYWGFYITNFVFFIGISHAGTLISAILRIARAEWRRAITRSAEVITVMVIFFGVASILMDLGRPDRVLYIIKFGRFQSPLLWDVTSITIYLTGSTVYLYLPLIPDIALMRDKVKKRKWFYSVLALGWRGTPKQWHRLEKAIAVMAILVIPVAVSVHTVVSYVFGMTVQPMWHSAIFGPYFVVGAIYSGIAALIVAMALIRWVYHLENYLKDIHFQNLGILLFVMTLLWTYFTFCEYLTTFYGAEPAHMQVFWSKFTGEYRHEFWGMVVCCFVIPVIFLSNRKMRTMTGMVFASLAITVGMWLERFIIVVPTLANPRLPYERGIYHPSWVELSLLAGCFAAFILCYVLFTKFFPIVSVWEIQEGRKHAVSEVAARVRTYLPGNPTPDKTDAGTPAIPKVEPLIGDS
ncbi:MAG: polysulfide reductase NrfD [Deltaproteobacteria bacterium]|nr:polysulfide reductase NrfD [Deltaproteobacteria bacterium]